MQQFFFIIASLFLLIMLSIFLKKYFDKPYEILITVASFYLIILSAISLLLTIAGRYDLFNVGIFLFIFSLIYFIYSYKNKNIDINACLFNCKTTFYGLKINFKLFLFTLFVISLIVLYVLFPTEYILGDRDPGLYLDFGVYISKTGGLELTDPLLRELHNAIGDALRLGYPGIYSGYERGLSQDPANLIPQFLHLFPALIANGYSLFGMDGLLRFNGIIGLVSLGIIFIFVRKISNIYAALVAVIIISINPAQLWNARITLTESFSQLLYFTALLVYVIANEKNNKVLYLLAGLILGLGCFNRVDSYVFGVAILLIAACAVVYNKKEFTYFAMPFFVLELLSVAYGYKYSYPYYYDLWILGSLYKLFLLHMISLVILVTVFLFKTKIKAITKQINKKLDYNGILGYIILGAGLVLMVWAYLLRPALAYYIYHIEPSSYEYFKAFSFYQFSWYLPLFITLFGAWGLVHIFKNLNWGYVLFGIIGLLTIVGYFYDPSITPDHIWASRRWVPITIPTLVILSSLGIMNVCNDNKIKKNIVIIILLISYVIFAIDKSKPFLFNSILNGLNKQYIEISKQIPDDAIILTDNALIASPLKLVYEREAYIVNFNAINNIDKLAQKDDVFMITNQGKNLFHYLSPNSKYTVKDLGIYPFKGKYLELVKNKFPSSLYMRDYSSNMYRIEPKNRSGMELLPSNNMFSTQVGKVLGTGMISQGKQGFVIFGPYAYLSKGNYKVVFNGEIIQKGKQDKYGFIDVASNKGQKIIARKYIDKSSSLPIDIDFQIDNATDVEFRFYEYEGFKVKLTSIEVLINRGE